jgi:hypothetical protein
MIAGMTAPPTLTATAVPVTFSTIGTVYCMPKKSTTLSDASPCSGSTATGMLK